MQSVAASPHFHHVQCIGIYTPQIQLLWKLWKHDINFYIWLLIVFNVDASQPAFPYRFQSHERSRVWSYPTRGKPWYLFPLFGAKHNEQTILMHYFDDILILGIPSTKIWCSLLRLLVVGYAWGRNDHHRHGIERFTTQDITLNAHDYCF